MGAIEAGAIEEEAGPRLKAGVTVGLVAVVACAASLVVFWPGIAMYDSVAQYRQALTGTYDDWHPPVMARLWSVFGADGTAPMLLMQFTPYWLGFGLIATCLARIGRARAAWVVIGIGLWPPLLGWQAVVLKDTQMLGALLAAVGIVSWWRLRGERVPIAAAVLAGALIAYATLVRANAVFACVPLAVGLIGWPRRIGARVAVTIGTVGLVLAVAPTINHRLLGAEPSGVEKTQALYDLAAIGAATRDPAATSLSAATIATIRDRHCVSPFFWDPLGDPAHCNDAVATLRARPVAALYQQLARAMVRHPIAYAAHRLRHLNSTERWLVPRHWPNAAPPATSEPNTLGLSSPGAAAHVWQSLADWLVEMPTTWPICWAIVALTLLAATRGRAASPARGMALALIASALTLEASFAPLSIASDLRYHLWPMLATALAAVLLADGGRWRRRALWTGGAVLLVVVVGGIAARALLPLPPATYAGMLG